MPTFKVTTLGRAPEDGAACVITRRMGRKLKRIPQSGPYTMCLNSNQAKKLFGGKTPGEPIGCGTFACAWPANQKQIVKITKDREDVDGLVAAEGMARVVRVDQIFRLPGAGRDSATKQPIDLYAIVAERVKPLTPYQKKLVKKPLEAARMAMLKRAAEHRGEVKTFKVLPEWTAKLRKYACKTDKQKKWCPDFVESFAGVFASLFRRGVVWQDAHSGNIGVDSKGRWKALDLGFSGTKRRANIPALNGTGRR
jgi:hypothetical protein